MATDPPGGDVVLAAYRDTGSGRLVESELAPIAAGETRVLAPGSYVALARSQGRLPTRYPFTLDRGEERALRIALPRRDDVLEGMIYIPAGRFLYGSGDGEPVRSALAHQPMRPIDVPAFLVARTETNWGDYVAFLRTLPAAERKARTPSSLSFDAAGRASVAIGGAKLAEGEAYCPPGRPCVGWARLPVVYVSRDDGEAYAAWLAGSGRLPGARLCTDREWERAARGADDRRFPWGDADPGPDDACSLEAFAGDAHAAGPCEPSTHPASRSPFGVDDMAGNVWEWTAGTPDVAEASMASVRGGGFVASGALLSVDNRGLTSERAHVRSYGLRLCADAR